MEEKMMMRITHKVEHRKREGQGRILMKRMILQVEKAEL